MLFSVSINLDAKSVGNKREVYVFPTPWGLKGVGVALYDVALTLESTTLAGLEKSVGNTRVQVYTGEGTASLAPTDKRVICDAEGHQYTGAGKLTTSGIYKEYLAREDVIVDKEVTVIVEYNKSTATDLLRFGVRFYYDEESLGLIDYLRLIGR